MGVLAEFIKEFGLFIVYIIVAVCGVFAGKYVRDRKNAKKAAEESQPEEI